MRQLEFLADEEGDWAFHCHKSHHTMNAMGHDVPTMIGVPQDDLASKINDLVPGYMAMGERGMDEMATMRMALPENTAPMMMGEGPFGAIGMGGMFSVVKVRRNQKRGDYRDPGWYQHPPGTVAYEYTGPTPPAVQSREAGSQSMPRAGAKQGTETVVTVRKPSSGHKH
jgi:hypothetical protein